MLKRLHLANTRRVWKDLVARADTESWPARRLLATLLVEEVAHRQQTRLSREVRNAGFPFLKTIDDFDFSFQKTLKRRLITGYLSPELVSEGRNAILFGRTGRGKTHLAIAIAYRAVQNDFSARFVTAAHLIDDLSRASRDGRLREALAPYLHPAVLVVDEVGYLTYGNDAANVLFHVVNERHLKRRPILFTTNKSPFTQWGEVLHDPDLAETIVVTAAERWIASSVSGALSRSPRSTRRRASTCSVSQAERLAMARLLDPSPLRRTIRRSRRVGSRRRPERQPQRVASAAIPPLA